MGGEGHDHLDAWLGELVLDAEVIRRRVRELGAQITRDYRGTTLHLIGILKGASIFHSDLIRSIELDVTVDFMAVASYGGAARTTGEVRILKDLDESLEGRHVLVVEDILDSGLTLHYLLGNLQSRGPRSLKVVALLNKPARREIDVRADYVGFEVPDRFLVGYGLDFDQRYRNLPHISTLEIRRI